MVVYDIRFQNNRFNSEGSGEEAVFKILASFNELSNTLRQLKDIPLEITTVQGTSAVFRYSELFPALPNVHTSIKKILKSTDTAHVFKTDAEMKHVPLYIAPIEGKYF